MDLGSNDWLSIASWSGAGLVLGSLYSLINIYVTKQTNSQSLHPLTDCLYKDTVLFALFVRLQEHRHLNDKAFIDAVNNADRLLWRSMQLEERKIQPSITDRSESYLYFTLSIQNLTTLLEISKKTYPPKKVIQLYSLYSNIYDMLVVQWTNVLKLTQNVHR